MGTFPVVLLLCGLHALTAVVQAQETDDAVVSTNEPPNTCREELYPCTRMYSVHQPMKRCIGGLCLYSLARVYVVNNEICSRTVCQDEEYRKAERCRELSGWPRRLQRSTLHKKRCRNLRSNPKPWPNKA